MDSFYQSMLEECGNFLKWIDAAPIAKNMKIHFSDEFENFMTVVDEKIYFRQTLRQKTTREFYLSMMLHELFHVALQGIPNIKEVRLMKKVIGGELFMAEYDIQADLTTARYLKEVKGFDLTQMLRALYVSAKEFPRDELANAKISRFLGSLVSIEMLYVTNKFITVLPTIFSFTTGQSLYIHVRVSVQSTRFEIVEISKEIYDLTVSLFLFGGNMGENEFISNSRMLAKLLLEKMQYRYDE